MNAKFQEQVLDPGREIVDAHHHLWERASSRYMLQEFLQDAENGHNVRQSVFIQCRTGYRHGTQDSPAMETHAIAEATRECQQAGARVQVAAGIVGYADMLQGDAVAALLDTHIEAGQGRFKGVRHIVSWAPGTEFRVEGYPTAPGMLGAAPLRAAMRQLARRALSFEAMVYHTQLDELAGLATTHDDTRIVLNHIGIPLGLGNFAGQQAAVFDDWKRGLRAVAACPNVCIKLGGMGMHYLGLAPHDTATNCSQTLAARYKPYIEACMEAFGAQRCMFESNFPVDRSASSYHTLWNAFKRATTACSEEEKNRLFAGTAREFYRLA